MSNNTDISIQKFVNDNFNLLHQHIRVYEINHRISSSFKKIMDGECINYAHNTNTTEWTYLHKTQVHYYDTDKDSKAHIEFLVPVRILNRGKKLLIQYNTFARDIKSYFNYTIYVDRMGNPENEIMENINHNFSNPIFKLDLNKGVKYLWENDVIDAVIVKNRESKSIRQERMDESFTYKKSYPDAWVDLMKTPIQKTRFISLIQSKIPLNHFECNPSDGFVGVSIHANTNNEVIDLLNLILRHN